MPAFEDYMFAMCIPDILDYFKNRNKENLKMKIRQFSSKMLKIKQLLKQSLLPQGQLQFVLNKNKTISLKKPETPRKHG